MSEGTDPDGGTAPEDDLGARARALEARIAELELSTRDLVIRAELKAEALQAGIVDLDGLKLADLSTVSLDDKGAVVGATAVIAGLRRAKPWLFGAASSSSAAGVPQATAPRAKLATEMSHVEWQAARREMIRRR